VLSANGGGYGTATLIPQVIFGRSIEKGWRKYSLSLRRPPLLRESPEVDVHIVTHEPE